MKNIGVFYKTSEFKEVIYWFLTKNSYKCYKINENKIIFNDSTEVTFFRVNQEKVRLHKLDDAWMERDMDATYYNNVIFLISNHIRTINTIYDLADILRDYEETL